MSLNDQPADLPAEMNFARVCNLVRDSVLVKAFLLITVLVNISWVYRASTERYNQHDFAHYYVTSKIYLENKEQPSENSLGIYGTDLRPEYEKLGWKDFAEEINYPTNPPLLIKLFSLYALLSPETAFHAWSVTQIVSLCLSVWVSFLLVREHLHPNVFWLVLAVFLYLPFVRTHLVYSQIQLPLMAMILVAYLVQKKNLGWLACLIVTFAALIKMYPLVLLPWFVLRSGKSFNSKIGAGLLSAIVLVGGVWLTDWSLWQSFFETARPRISNWVTGSQCFTLSSFFYDFGVMATGNTESKFFLQFGLLMGVVLLCSLYAWVAFLRPAVDERGRLVEFSILLILMLICGATCWWHYLVFLLLPMAVVAITMQPEFTLKKLVVCLVGIAALNPILSTLNSRWIGPMLIWHAPLLVMITMAIYLLQTELHRKLDTSATSN